MKKLFLVVGIFMLFLTGCQKKPESLQAVEDCINNFCEDENVEELLGVYFDEYMENEYSDNPFKAATQRPNFYGKKEDDTYLVGTVLGMGYIDETSSYPKTLEILEVLHDIYGVVGEIEVSTSTEVLISATYSIRENENSYTLHVYYDPFEEFDGVRISYIFKDEYNEETVESVLSYLKDFEEYFALYGEVNFLIYTEHEDIELTFLLETNDLTIKLENLIESKDPTQRLSEIESIIKDIVEKEYSINSYYAS